MTWSEVYDSYTTLYRNLMVENKWTTTQIDEMDTHFFFEIMNDEPVEKEVYLSDVW